MVAETLEWVEIICQVNIDFARIIYFQLERFYECKILLFCPMCQQVSLEVLAYYPDIDRKYLVWNVFSM